MAYLFIGSRFQAFDNSGNPLNGGKVYFYEAGGSTPKNTYTDQGGGTPNANPVILDSAGRASIWLGEGAYRVVVKSSDDATTFSDTDNMSAAGASSFTFTPAGTGATSRTIESKLRDWVHALDFGADNSGDDTTPLKNAFDYCIPNGRTLVLKGAYTVSGAISTVTQIASGSLHIFCDGDVTITVDSGATAFNTLLSCYTTAINSSSISGGRLTINLNNKCANGIYLRHAGGKGGAVDWGPVKVLSAKQNTASASEDQALLVYGRYESVTIQDPQIDGVTRVFTGASAASSGIGIAEVEGPVTIIGGRIANVTCSTTKENADGIKVFGYTSGATYTKRNGSLTLIGTEFVDCEGRSIKTQISQSKIMNPRFVRGVSATQGISTGADIDHQVGGKHDIEDPVFEYRKFSGADPFVTGFQPIALQVRCTDRPNAMRVAGTQFMSESAIRMVVFVLVGAASIDGAGTDALNGSVVIEGTVVQGLGALAGGVVLSGGLVEFDPARVQANPNTHSIETRFNEANLAGRDLVIYAGATSANATNLRLSAVSNINTGSSAGVDRVAATSGTTITSFGLDRTVSNSNIT